MTPSVRANLEAEDALIQFPKPTIAFLRGSCVGGGVQLASSCDLRIADSTALLGITPARLGIIYPARALERTVKLIGAPRGQAPVVLGRAHRRPAGAADRAGRRGPRTRGRPSAARRVRDPPRERTLPADPTGQQGHDRCRRRRRRGERGADRAVDGGDLRVRRCEGGHHRLVERRAPNVTWTGGAA